MLEFSDEHRAIRSTTAKFARERIGPWHEEDESQARFRPEVVSEMGALGFWGVLVPEEFGGTGVGFLAGVLITEELARVSPAYAGQMIVQGVAIPRTLLTYGSRELAERYTPGVIAGELIGCFAATEPDVGADVGAITCSARRDGTDYVLRGTKTWVTNGPAADVGLMFVSTDKAREKRGLSCLVVDLRETSNVTRRETEKLGQRCARVGDLTFDNARVSVDCLVGREGDGFEILMALLSETRLFAAARALGLAAACLDACVDYAVTRTQFGVPIGKHQMVQEQIAEMYAAEQAARALVYRTARDKDGQGAPLRDVAAGKYVACEAAVKAAMTAMRIYGAYGYAMEYPVQRFLRDAVAMVTTEGSSNIQKIIMARELLNSGNSSHEIR